jgi:formylmethanofuran dehydrogenase subunit E
MAGPFAVAGYRMGARALRELGLREGSFDLEVRHESPAEVQWSCIADGAQAATGASPGKLNLQLQPVAREAMRTVFRRRSTGKTLITRLTPAFVRRFLDLPREQLAAAGATVAALRDEEIFSVERP